jgi:hypothetical protein
MHSDHVAGSSGSTSGSTRADEDVLDGLGVSRGYTIRYPRAVYCWPLAMN